MYGFYITLAGVSARSLRAPRSALPLPDARIWRARAGRGGGCPSPWGGAALYPVAVLAGCVRLLLPLRVGVCPRPAVCPRRVGRAVGFRALRVSLSFFDARRWRSVWRVVVFRGPCALRLPSSLLRAAT